MFIVAEDIESYAALHSRKEIELLQALREETQASMQYPQMLTGPLEGAFLAMLLKISGAKHVLEIGTFTGYSALSMAAALPADGKVVTCELDLQTCAFAQRYFDKSPHGKKIELRQGPALKTIQSLDTSFDFVFIDADKENYPNYYQAVKPMLSNGGLIAIDNTLWSGRVLRPEDEESRSIDKLNKMIAADESVENVLLTIRDGIQLVRTLR
jgi:caffeoyl-CoA O-methyltransferase